MAKVESQADKQLTLAERVTLDASDYAKRTRGNDWRKADGGYWRGSTVGLCARQQGYSYLGYEETRPEAHGSRAMSLEDGHVHEAAIINRIKSLPGVKVLSSNETIKRTYKTKKGVTIKLHGTPDLVIEENGIKKVVEIKALQVAAFEEVQSKKEPPQKYVTQLKVYMLLTGISLGELFIKNRNNSEKISFTYELDEFSKKSLVQRLAWLQDFVDKKELPPKEYQLGSQECFYCPFSKECWPTENFKGYIHKESDKEGINVDLDELPEVASVFLVSVKMYESAKAQLDKAQANVDEAKEALEGIMKTYKASAVSAGGYTAKSVVTERWYPNKEIQKKLIEDGTLPQEKSSSSYVRVTLPKPPKDEK